MSQAEILQALPEAQRKHVDPGSPGPMRMMAAKGLAPLPPREMVMVLCGLSLDADEGLSASAGATLTGLPDKILAPFLEGDAPAAAFMVLAGALGERAALLEKFVLNRNVPDDAVAQIAPNAPAAVAEIVASNQERCLRSRAIVEAIRINPNVLRSSLDRLFDFLVRAGVIYEGIQDFADAIARLNPTEMQEVADKVELPPEAMGLIDDTAESDERAEDVANELDNLKDESVKDRMPVLKLIGTLNVAQKISLALKGNKEARTALIRDTNRVVATSAIRSPRITEQEVVAAAKSRQVSDDVIRIIAQNKEYVRAYTVKLALVQNPKTPTQTAMRFMPLLRTHDLRMLAKSKNIPSAISTHAKRLVARKK